MDLWQTMDNVETAAFNFDINGLGLHFGALIEQMMPLMNGLQEFQLLEANQTLTAMLTAMQNHDYLLLADLLHFELKPFINRILS